MNDVREQEVSALSQYAAVAKGRRLEGQIAFVTGASSGLGARFAKLLASEGASVVLAARRLERLEGLRDEIQGAGGRAYAMALDVADVAAFDAALDQSEAALGPVSLLINNAGLNVHARATDITTDDYDALFGVNLRGPFFLAAACAKRWIARPSPGRIVNIASLSAYRALPAMVPYAMSKAAMVHMTAGLAREWARHDIIVNGIAPGYVRTEINDQHWDTPAGQKLLSSFPRRRVGEPEDLDGALMLLADPAQRFITGQTLIVDDGQGLA